MTGLTLQILSTQVTTITRIHILCGHNLLPRPKERESLHPVPLPRCRCKLAQWSQSNFRSARPWLKAPDIPPNCYHWWSALYYIDDTVCLRSCVQTYGWPNLMCAHCLLQSNVPPAYTVCLRSCVRTNGWPSWKCLVRGFKQIETYRRGRVRAKAKSLPEWCWYLINVPSDVSKHSVDKIEELLSHI